jgi:hypothetical protein
MSKQATNRWAYAILIMASVASLILVRSLGPTSFSSAALLSMWLLLPYVVLAVILATATSATSVAPNLAVTSAVVVGGLCFLTYTVFVRPDPQGGIAVFFAPIYQGTAIALLVPLSRLFFGKRST